jgi:hypothetical protein
VTPSVDDRDFVRFQMTTSLHFLVGMPEPWMQCDKVSFYRGTPTVILKNQVFEPSSAMPCGRGAQHDRDAGASCEGDHGELHGRRPRPQENFITVILADIAQWLVGYFDILVYFRTPVGLSIRNLAERLMSVLNLALYGMAC